uniref:Uncharacterized protein n=1 Tax=Anguilla anguilla TaxID=7936 RepID=A0A0E9TND7_ANGAN
MMCCGSDHLSPQANKNFDSPFLKFLYRFNGNTNKTESKGL